MNATSATVDALSGLGKDADDAAVGLVLQRNMGPCMNDVHAVMGVLQGLGKAKKAATAVIVLRFFQQHGMELSAFLASATINACSKGGEWKLALQILGEMAQGRVERNTITYNAAASACEKGGQWLRAMELMDEMAQGRVERNTITYLSLIHI